jgi:very-short-patch-repair endonuclease
MLELPGRDADELEWVTFEQAGILTTAQAVELAGSGVVRGHLNAGRWRRVCRGVLATHNGPLGRARHLWVAVLVAGTGAVLAGTTALTEAGVRGLSDDPIRVLVPADRHRTLRLPRLPRDMPSVTVTRTRTLPADHLQVGRPPRTTSARAAVDAAIWAPTADGARVVLATVCQQQRVTPDEIFKVLASTRKLPRRSLMHATLLDIAGGAQALSEIDFVNLCRRFRLPSPDQQVKRKDAGGRLRYLDAYWQQWRLHVEIDGAHHMNVAEWTDDMTRQNHIWIRGDRILRFPASALRARPVQVAAQLQAALEAGGWRP